MTKYWNNNPRLWETDHPWFCVHVFGACYWIHFGKYVLRIGKFWGHYKYAWWPFLQWFKCYK